MKLLSHLLACGLAVLQPLVAGNPVPDYFDYSPITRRDLPVQKVEAELGWVLSKGSTIFGPSDSRWDDAVKRYNTFTPPDIQIVAQPAKESDISKIHKVKYCNKNSIDFMVVNRGHAITSSVGTFKGLQIDMASLRNIDIQHNNQTAWFQGGTYDGQVMEVLWEKGYVATTGSCSCVGMMGPGLGSGHGRYEGQYGLISDNLVTLNVVLADGSEVRVNKDHYADLFWAIQGAGHNYGILALPQLHLEIYQFSYAGAYYLLLYYLPIYFQSIGDTSPIGSGVRNLPMVISVSIAGLAGGITVSKTGHATPFMVIGAALATVGTGLLYTLDIGTSSGKWIGYQILAGCAFSFPFQITMNIVQANAEPQDISSVTTIIFFFQVLGGAFSLSAAQCAFANTLVSKLSTIAPDIDKGKVVATGATVIRSTFNFDEMRGIFVAYMAGIKAALAVAIGLTGTLALVSWISPWKKLHGGAEMAPVA